MFDLNKIVRNNILNLQPYTTARDEFKGVAAKIFLDANENPFGSPTLQWQNRYPDPLQSALKEKISLIKNIPPDHIFLGNGSDECIDVIFKCFCEPGKDNSITCPPTYGMYKVSASIQNIRIKEVQLLENFQLDTIALESSVDDFTKIIWLCSPNNPTGNALFLEDIEMVLNNFNGIVVVDEAYINYSRKHSFAKYLSEYPNLIVLQTFSKAWGLAGIRLGMALANPQIIGYLNKIKSPYNINNLSAALASEALDNLDQVNEMINETVQMRIALSEVFEKIPAVRKVYPSDANFLLVKFDDAKIVYEHLLNRGIVVRNRSNDKNCEGCLRITVGTEEENTLLVDALCEL